MDLLTRCDRVAANTPFVKWAEPVHVLLSALQDSCLVFSAQKFPAIVCDANFLKMMQVMPMNMDFVSARGMGSVKFECLHVPNVKFVFICIVLLADNSIQKNAYKGNETGRSLPSVQMQSSCTCQRKMQPVHQETSNELSRKSLKTLRERILHPRTYCSLSQKPILTHL